MNTDSYKIIISLSHHRISYEYWLRDAENKLVAMPGGRWPAPLAFFCSPQGMVEVGESAARAAKNGIANAYDNYFERLEEDRTYQYGGHSRPIRNLLLDGSEAIFNDFFRKVLLNRLGSLNDNRANMPLTIVCESDVKPNEWALLHGIFSDCGYSRVKVVDYDKYIGRYIKERLAPLYPCEKVLVVWTEGTDLTFTLYDVNSPDPLRQNTYPGLGVDPRKEYVKTLIWDQVRGQNPWLDRAEEEDALDKAATDFFLSGAPLVNDTVQLSDGGYNYTLNRTSIDYFQSNEGNTLKATLDRFLRDNGIESRNRTMLLLRGIAAGNTYFENNLSQGFRTVIKTDKKLRENTLNYLIAEANPASASPSTTPSYSTASPATQSGGFGGGFGSGFSSGSGFDAGTGFDNGFGVREPKPRGESGQKIKEKEAPESAAKTMREPQQPEPRVQKPQQPEPRVQSAIRVQEPQQPVSPAADETTLKDLQRRWRELNATAQGKARAGRPMEAIMMLSPFLKEASKVHGADEIVAKVAAVIDFMHGKVKDSFKPTPRQEETDAAPAKRKGSKHQDGDLHPNGLYYWDSTVGNGKGDWRVIGGRKQKMKAKQEAEQKASSEGHRLIAEGKLKEARDWFRNEGDTTMTATLNAIIRAQRGLQTRKEGLDACRFFKNRAQINRIIEEIQSYLTLCNQAGVDAGEYRNLLIEYKKIL